MALALVNCDTNANFDGNQDNASEDLKDDPIINELGGDDGDENEPISVPVEVTGAFLTCSNSLPDTASDNVYGCGVYKNEKKLDLDTKSLRWTVLGQDLSEITIRPVDKKENPWHLVFESDIKVADVIVSIPNTVSSDKPIGDSEGSRSTILKWSTYVKAEGETPTIKTSIATAFHIGDNKNYQSSCKEGIESENHFGKSVQFKITVKQSADVFLKMEGICGIDTYYKNSIKLISENGQIIQSNFLNANPGAVGGYNIKSNKYIEAGTYFLKIETTLYKKDYDDFVVKNLIIESVSDVTVTRVED